MSTYLLIAAIAALSLVHGAEPANADEAATAPAPTETAAEPEAATESDNEATEAAPAETVEAEEVEKADESGNPLKRPTETASANTERVGAFWFISIGK